jgi:DNA topoisomerase-2
MVDKKDEHDALENLSEKDLWCQDLDAFVQEWEYQLKENEDYEKKIRNTNRRASRKIGAGKNVKSRGKNDDEYNPKPAKTAPAKVVTKVEHHKGFLEMFNAKPKPKPKTGLGSDGADEGLSDDDFAALKAVKTETAQASRAPSEQPGPANGRSKRAAAAAPKKWVIDDDESESDDSKYLGDVGDMVKGIGSKDSQDGRTANGRLSLFAMSGPSGSHTNRPTSSSGLPKPKPKASKAFDLSDGDETNYEMLARSSPHKAPPAPKDTLDSFLSDEDDDIMPIVTKRAPVKAPAKAPVKAPAVAKAFELSDDADDMDDLPIISKKPASKAPTKAVAKAPIAKAPVKRAPKKPAAPKETAPTIESKPSGLSPMAKAYAAKKAKSELLVNKDAFSEDEDDIEMNDSPPPKRAKAPAKRMVVSDDEEEDDVTMEDSSPPKPASRGRPARAAVAKAKTTKKPIYIDSDEEDEEDEEDDSVMVEDEPSEDDFDDESE